MPTAPRILVVEDNVLYAELVSDFIASRGIEVVGPVGSLQAGLDRAQRTELDGAILDINLNGRYCFPICGALSERHIPFVFLTAYGSSAIIPKEFRTAPLISKPFEPMRLKSVVERMVGSAGSAGTLASTGTPCARSADLR
jgi:DNA-binding response OmpR family regulator